jgi:hypothetical protein
MIATKQIISQPAVFISIAFDPLTVAALGASGAIPAALMRKALSTYARVSSELAMIAAFLDSKTATVVAFGSDHAFNTAGNQESASAAMDALLGDAAVPATSSRGSGRRVQLLLQANSSDLLGSAGARIRANETSTSGTLAFVLLVPRGPLGNELINAIESAEFLRSSSKTLLADLTGARKALAEALGVSEVTSTIVSGSIDARFIPRVRILWVRTWAQWLASLPLALIIGCSVGGCLFLVFVALLIRRISRKRRGGDKNAAKIAPAIDSISITVPAESPDARTKDAALNEDWEREGRRVRGGSRYNERAYELDGDDPPLSPDRESSASNESEYSPERGAPYVRSHSNNVNRESVKPSRRVHRSHLLPHEAGQRPDDSLEHHVLSARRPLRRPLPDNLARTRRGLALAAPGDIAAAEVSPSVLLEDVDDSFVEKSNQTVAKARRNAARASLAAAGRGALRQGAPAKQRTSRRDERDAEPRRSND